MSAPPAPSPAGGHRRSGSGSKVLEAERQDVMVNLAERSARPSVDEPAPGDLPDAGGAAAREREQMTVQKLLELQAKRDAVDELRKLHDDAVNALELVPDDDSLLRILKDVSADLQLLEIEVAAQQLWEHTESVERVAGVVDLTEAPELEDIWRQEWGGTLLKRLGKGEPVPSWKVQQVRILRRKVEKEAKRNASQAIGAPAAAGRPGFLAAYEFAAPPAPAAEETAPLVAASASPLPVRRGRGPGGRGPGAPLAIEPSPLADLPRRRGQQVHGSVARLPKRRAPPPLATASPPGDAPASPVAVGA